MTTSCVLTSSHLNSGSSKYDNSCNTCSGSATTNCLACNYNGDGLFLN